MSEGVIGIMRPAWIEECSIFSARTGKEFSLPGSVWFELL